MLASSSAGEGADVADVADVAVVVVAVVVVADGSSAASRRFLRTQLIFGLL